MRMWGGNPINFTDPSGLLSLFVGGSLRIPGWVKYIIPDYQGQGGGAGLAVSYSDGQFDFGGYATVQGGDSDYGIGRSVVNIGLQGGSVSDLAGTGGNVSVHVGPIGATANVNNKGGFNGGSIDLGPGYNVGGSGSVTGTWSLKNGVTSPNSAGSGGSCSIR